MASVGRTTVSESKMMFYPTDKIEQYRTFFFMVNLYRADYLVSSIVSSKYHDVYLDERSSGVYTPIPFKSFLSGFPYDFHYLLAKEDFDSLYKILYGDSTSICYKERSKYDSNYHVVCDLFCGDGTWLNMYNLWGDYITIGNEIEMNRYEECKKKNIDILYNLAYEEMILPKNSVDIMLYNPPYGTSNGIKNSYAYLKDILEKQYIQTSGFIICVLRKEDMRNIIELISTYGDIRVLYRVNQEEYNKYNQFVLIAQIDNGKSFKSYTQSNTISRIKECNNIIDGEYDFYHTPLIDSGNFYPPYHEKTTPIKYKLFIAKNISLLDKKIFSNYDDKLWNMLKEKTKAPSIEIKKIIMPRLPKYSEISNIIAAGYINSDFDENDEIPHVAVGGVSQDIEEKETIKEDSEEVETAIYKKATPYLNVLYVSKDEVNEKMCYNYKEISKEEDLI